METWTGPDWIRVADAAAVGGRPVPVTVAGRRIALVRLVDGGPVRAFADHGPHRLVPLSAGTVAGGRLRC
ncbi:MAG TPA: Rieske 2Fe-2S domain-containing protein, partial [Rugosimonospora sp.]|nr:Rieske 2Fe-2S domain-containing protein [Rugosimonospora sp.]